MRGDEAANRPERARSGAASARWAPTRVCRGGDTGRAGTGAPFAAPRGIWGRFRAAMLGAAMLSASSGCTLIGAGVGSAFPMYTAVRPASPEWFSLRPGTEIAVDLVHAARVRQCAHTKRGTLECTLPAASHRLTGRYLGTDSSHLWIGVKEGPLAVDLGEIERVSRVDGSYWRAGTVIGLAVDVAVLTAFFVAHPLGMEAGVPH